MIRGICLQGAVRWCFTGEWRGVLKKDQAARIIRDGEKAAKVGVMVGAREEARMIHNVLILDTETTGLDPAEHYVLEVGAILYSIRHATVMECFSSLIARGCGNEAEAVNRIPAAALPHALDEGRVVDRLDEMAAEADAVLAHNAEFDRSFLPFQSLQTLPWICTQDDVRWPKQTRERSTLVHLALEHDLGIGYAHRALADCDLIARLLTRAHELGCDLQALLARGLRPKAELVGT